MKDTGKTICFRNLDVIGFQVVYAMKESISKGRSMDMESITGIKGRDTPDSL